MAEQVKRLAEENATLQKDLKVARSQNLRDKEAIRQMQQERTAYGPYQAALDDSNNLKLHQKSNMFECGPGSGLSGVSGVSAVSGNSGVSSNNLTRSQKNQHQFSSLHQQVQQQPLDRLSLSENRGQQVSQQVHPVPANNYVATQDQHQQPSEMPYKTPATSSGVKMNLGGTGNDSNTQSNLSMKQSNVHTTGKPVSQSIRASKEKTQNNKYASCSPGIIKPAFSVH